MITIVLTVSRDTYLTRVLTCLELLQCKHEEVNLLVIVDGSNELYVKTRNLANDLKFNERLIVRTELAGAPSKLNIIERRKRIAAHHNQARKLISHDDGYVFSVEDDTTFETNALQQLIQVAISHRAFGMAEGVEMGRWGVPYVGAWKADDIYNPTLLESVENKYSYDLGLMSENIDAGGLYCALIRADLYKLHEFTSANGLGPDVNFGLELRQLGFENFIVWSVPCAHYYDSMGVIKNITPDTEGRIVKLVKESDTKWRVIT